MRSNDTGHGTVYSTEHGRMCPDCNKPAAACLCSAKRTIPRSDGIVRVVLERSGRKGKGVTVITGIPLDHDGLLLCAKQLKQKCGSGGTVKNNAIEIQGDWRDKLVEEMQKQGYRVRS